MACLQTHCSTLLTLSAPTAVSRHSSEEGDVELALIGAQCTPGIGVGAGAANNGLGQGDRLILDASAAANSKHLAIGEVATAVLNHPVCKQQNVGAGSRAKAAVALLLVAGDALTHQCNLVPGYH